MLIAVDMFYAVDVVLFIFDSIWIIWIMTHDFFVETDNNIGHIFTVSFKTK